MKAIKLSQMIQYKLQKLEKIHNLPDLLKKYKVMNQIISKLLVPSQHKKANYRKNSY